MMKETLINPISLLPVVKKSGHRHPINGVGFCSTVLPDRTVINQQGSYITVSKEGTINFLSTDLEIQRSGRSKNPHFKASQTWILAIVALSDVRIICTSSTERDLRFYDTTAINFHLRIIITSLPWAVCCMHYTFQKSLTVTCKLLLGDYGGNIRLLEFYPELRGPFQNKPGAALIELSWTELVKGKLPRMKVREFLSVHNDIIRQVSFCDQLNLVFSAAESHACHTTTTYNASLVAIDLGVKKSRTVFSTPKGITCFAVDAENILLVTGGPDCFLRLWNPFVPQKPSAALAGHHSGIVYVFIQSDESKVYSLDHNKVIKIWDLDEQILIQTYFDLAFILPYKIPFSCYYNSTTHELIVASRKIVSIKCCPLIRLDLSDGETHSKTVSVILYNTLFKFIISCGLDSCIIVWNPWTGKRLCLIKQAHTRVLYGELRQVEITAACFNPPEQLLLTGARDGTLKIWNFNSGICIRNLSIENMCEVTNVFWVKNRILAMGWNRHITEFADVKGQEYGDGKEWVTLHGEDILCAAVCSSHALATGSYSGGLILWKLETGQPYKRYDIESPEIFIKLAHEGKTFDGNKLDTTHRMKDRTHKLSKRISASRIQDSFQSHKNNSHISNKYEEKKCSSLLRTAYFQESLNTMPMAVGQQKVVGTNRYRRLSVMQVPNDVIFKHPQAIKTMIFLQTRPMSKEYGSLFVAIENGKIQVYSHHQMGGLLEQFHAVHKQGDCVVAMSTDKRNKYLFTGTAFGYIKTWLVCNFGIPESEHIRISLPKLRLEYPFLLKDRFLGRAKRVVRDQKNLLLLNAYKAHIRAITSLTFINKVKILISASNDCTVRLWTLGGLYVGTLGSPLPWTKLSSSATAKINNYRIPPDVKKIASTTTLKVLSGAQTEKFDMLKIEAEVEDYQNGTTETPSKCIYGGSLTEPLLGKHFKIPQRGQTYLKPILDKSLPYIPVYSHLEIHPALPIERPATPDILQRTRDLEFMNRNQ